MVVKQYSMVQEPWFTIYHSCVVLPECTIVEFVNLNCVLSNIIACCCI